MRGNGYKLKCRRFQLNMRGHSFSVRVTEHWNRLPREVMESPSLEIFKTHLDVIQCNMLRLSLLGRGVGPGDLQMLLPTSAML